MRVGVTILALFLPLVCAADKLKLEPAEKYGAVALSLRLEDKCPSPGSATSHVSFEGILQSGKAFPGLFPISVGDAPLVGFMMKDPLKNPPGRFVTQRLPVGSYRLIEFIRTGRAAFRSANDLDVYFDVKPGVVSYLGELYFRILDCEQFDLRVNDQQQRDSALFDQQIDDVESSSWVRELVSIPDMLIGPQPRRP